PFRRITRDDECRRDIETTDCLPSDNHCYRSFFETKAIYNETATSSTNFCYVLCIVTIVSVYGNERSLQLAIRHRNIEMGRMHGASLHKHLMFT
ncbi:hypothetical protein CEXT_100901, partial [Caerostris extrusa]